MSTYVFLALKRVPGRKWLATGGTNSGTCIANAETIFDGEVEHESVDFGRRILNQKNFAGFSDDFRELSPTERETTLKWYRGAKNQWPEWSAEEFAEKFPGARQFVETGELS